ncbi:metalloregulator ArsR/SmtB family transcription factor [Anaerocolumna sedimenticola]|uniref:Metalloregulator ArsR/SmtB family transcription factor n=1 Tax=Anaerocolumna sedimenticola TaxID=2696063 RepID=A0A6P1TL53_9FIRM|nr:metalloregulator ArsR/SmtB family transcription factor [Anaerocolumna sedimenticola]QHQ60879.1 metalloregulator ArsR/SmtB family transcription factor [Anaerocolumna sedimenticola]
MDITMQLKAISDPTRYKIIGLLLERHYCVRILSKKLNISESAVSQHMSVLKEAGIVYGKKLGYHMHYIVKTDTLQRIRDEMSKMLQSAEQSSKEIKNCSCEYSCDR